MIVARAILIVSALLIAILVGCTSTIPHYPQQQSEIYVAQPDSFELLGEVEGMARTRTVLGLPVQTDGGYHKAYLAAKQAAGADILLDSYADRRRTYSFLFLSKTEDIIVHGIAAKWKTDAKYLAPAQGELIANSMPGESYRSVNTPKSEGPNAGEDDAEVQGKKKVLAVTLPGAKYAVNEGVAIQNCYRYLKLYLALGDHEGVRVEDLYHHYEEILPGDLVLERQKFYQTVESWLDMNGRSVKLSDESVLEEASIIDEP